MAEVAANRFKQQLSPLLKPKPGAVQQINIPKLKYLMVDGAGEPSDKAYQQAIQGLYGYIYTIKFLPKAGVEVSGYEPFSVAPLQGLYGSFEAGWSWTLMMAVPDFVTSEVMELAADAMRRKGKEVNAAVRLESWEEGDVIQTLHLGPYSEEQPAVDLLREFARTHNYVFTGRQNEIYLNDPRRVTPDKIKVIIRYQIRPA